MVYSFVCDDPEIMATAKETKIDDDIESYLNVTKVLGINTLLYDSPQKLSSQ